MGPNPHRVILEGWIAVLVPPEWTWNEEGGITCLYAREEGIGSINVSLFFRQGVAGAADEELIEQAGKFAKNLGARLRPEEIRMIEMDSAPASYMECSDDAGDHWRVWHTARDRRMVLLTYNCPVGDCDRERSLIDRIVKSFKWEPPAPADAHGRNGK